MTLPAEARAAVRPGDAAPTAGRWTAEVHRDDDALERFAAEWDALAGRCRTTTPFQYAGWLCSWWRQYGRPGALVLVLVRRDGRLAGAAALRRRGPLGALTGLGGALADFGDVLLDDDCAERAAAELAAALPLRRPWHSLDLREVHPDAAVHRVLAHHPGRTRRFDDSLCQYLPVVPMEELLKRLPGKTAQRSRVKLRRIAESGVVVDAARPEEVPQTVADLLRLHFLQWQDRGVTAEHRTERFAAHLTESTTAMVATGRAAMHRFTLDGELLAVNLVVLCPSFGGLYLYGAHPGLRERLDIAGLLFGAALDEVRTAGIPVLSLLRGQEPYKQRWRPDALRNVRLVAGPAGAAPVAAALALAVRARQVAVGVLNSRLPKVKEALAARRRA
jgi:hypothetical protein